jgi:hypothetical protein
MAAIAMGESSGNPNAHNPNRSTGDDSYGLWQINMLGRMGPERRRMFGISSDEDLKDPRINARAAYQIYKQQGFRAWTVWSSGKYRQYMGAAASAEPVSVGGAGGAGAGGSITSSGSVPRGAAAPTTPSGGMGGPTYGALSGREMGAFMGGPGGRRVMASGGPGGGMMPRIPRGYSPEVEAAAAQAKIATRGRFLNQGQFGPSKPQSPLEEAVAQARISLRGKLGPEQFGPFLPKTEDIYGPSDASLRAQDAAAAASEGTGAGGINYGGTDASSLADAARIGAELKRKKDEADTASLADISNPAAAYYDPATTREQIYNASQTDPDAIKWAEEQRAKMDAERASMDAETVGGVPRFDAKQFSADFAAKQAADQQAQKASADASLATGAGSMTSDDAAINAALFKAQMKSRSEAMPQGGISTTGMVEGGLRLAEQSASLEAQRMKQFQGESRPASAVQQGFADSSTNEGMGHIQRDEALAPSDLLRSYFGDQMSVNIP